MSNPTPNTPSQQVPQVPAPTTRFPVEGAMAASSPASVPIPSFPTAPVAAPTTPAAAPGSRGFGHSIAGLAAPLYFISPEQKAVPINTAARLWSGLSPQDQMQVRAVALQQQEDEQRTPLRYGEIHQKVNPSFLRMVRQDVTERGHPWKTVQRELQVAMKSSTDGDMVFLISNASSKEQFLDALTTLGQQSQQEARAEYERLIREFRPDETTTGAEIARRLEFIIARRRAADLPELHWDEFMRQIQEQMHADFLLLWDSKKKDMQELKAWLIEKDPTVALIRKQRKGEQEVKAAAVPVSQNRKFDPAQQQQQQAFQRQRPRDRQQMQQRRQPPQYYQQAPAHQQPMQGFRPRNHMGRGRFQPYPGRGRGRGRGFHSQPSNWQPRGRFNGYYPAYNMPVPIQEFDDYYGQGDYPIEVEEAEQQQADSSLESSGPLPKATVSPAIPKVKTNA